MPGWRFALTLETARRARENYYGIGNDAAYDEHLVTDAQPRYYMLKATRSFARGEMQLRKRLRSAIFIRTRVDVQVAAGIWVAVCGLSLVLVAEDPSILCRCATDGGVRG